MITKNPAPAVWDPKKTRVFVASVLQDEDGIAWPLESRRDTVLLERLRARGVPDANIVYLADAKVTTKAVEAALERHLAKAAPDELLIFYYAGHGDASEAGQGSFVFYDDEWPVTALFTHIERSFRGRAALLLADCCYSGSMALEALRRAGRIAYAALASSMSTVPSTGAWTFTNCIIDALDGRLAIDADGDGTLQLDELAAYAERSLAFADGQLSTFVTTNGFPAHFSLGSARPRGHERVGEYVDAEDDAGEQYRAQIVDSDGERFKLHWLGYEDGDDSWVPAAKARPLELPRHEPGTRVSAEYEKTWYPATVLAERWGMHLVHYEDEGDEWDEWLSRERIKPV